MSTITPPLKKRVKRYVRYLLLRALLVPVQLIPLSFASWLGERLGKLAFIVAGGERRKALESLRIAFPEQSEEERSKLARRSFGELGRTLLEMVRIRAFDARRHEYVEWDASSRAAMDAALARGKGVVFVTGHCGNWELLARYVALEGYAAAVVGKETSDPNTTKLLERFRTSGNLRVIWRGAPGAAKDLLRTLKTNAILGLLIDQDTKVQSVWVPFFGKLAKTPRAAADLALRTGAAPMLGFCTRIGPLKYRITMKELVVPQTREEEDVLALTAELTRGIENHIRANPAQWVWMHRRWKSPPP
ncbi:MAG: lipid A biosynthesis acyltransferase [Archangium gephyra]|uniref:Lipid A biosynthesis acyltransferase n=1 Tax=Archangium gephyra TaxID=48 RepID=A0A2W5T261_9BACT|nr:MAG: lipid A biosynthesis acyltransferase [Archangium gephyra]